MQLAASTKLMGLQKSQVHRLFWALNTSFSSQNRDFSVNMYSAFWNDTFKRFEYKIVNEVCPTSMDEFRTKLINARPGEPREVATDGTYPDKNGRNAVACGSALMAKVDNVWRIIDLYVTKR